MRCVIQRVRHASVSVAGSRVSAIGQGLLVLLAVQKGDAADAAATAAKKISELRIFSDENGKMNLSVVDVHGAVLAVSQFTLAGSLARGRRPSFDGAEEPQRANQLFERFVDALRAAGVPVETGAFGEMMDVELLNDGPVTFVLDI